MSICQVYIKVFFFTRELSYVHMINHVQTFKEKCVTANKPGDCK